jgi:hypothetical protein
MAGFDAQDGKERNARNQKSEISSRLLKDMAMTWTATVPCNN